MIVKVMMFYIFFVASAHVMAQSNWRSVGGGYYIDLKSIQKQGDLTRVLIRSPELSYERYINVDCKQEIVIWNRERNLSYSFNYAKTFSEIGKLVFGRSIFQRIFN